MCGTWRTEPSETDRHTSSVSRERERERQTDIQTDIDRETDRDKDRDKDRDRETVFFLHWLNYKIIKE